MSSCTHHHARRTFRSPSLSPVVDAVAAWVDEVVGWVDLGVGKVASEAARVVWEDLEELG